MTEGSVWIEKDDFTKIITKFIRSFFTKISELADVKERQIKLDNYN